MKTLFTLKGVLFSVIVLFLLQGCNPDCESLASGNIFAPSPPYIEGSQILISSNPPSLIENRGISISARGASGGSEVMELDVEFEDVLGAAIVTLPQGISSNSSLLVDDPDCSGQLIPVGSSFDLVDADFFVDNPFFVTPTPPLIIIPIPAVTVPTNVVNAWFSPNNRDYCIWFNPVLLDTLADGTIVEGSTLIPAGSPNGVGPVNGSVELAAGCSGELPRADRYYHNNPVSGFVDKENNLIRISIDRTSKGLDIEEFEGMFISPELVPEEYQFDGICSPGGDKEPFFMYLTSLKTGRQLILFRHPV